MYDQCLKFFRLGRGLKDLYVKSKCYIKEISMVQSNARCMKGKQDEGPTVDASQPAISYLKKILEFEFQSVFFM